MHFTENGQPANPSPEEIEQQARAHLLESSLTTMEDFLEQEDRHKFLTAYEHVYRATGDTYTTFAEKIAKVQEMVKSGEMSEGDMARNGYEPTRFILLIDPKRSTGDISVVFYEGRVSGAKGYGVLNIEARLSVIEMEAFTSPQHLLETYGDEVVISAARVINDRNDLIGLTAHE